MIISSTFTDFSGGLTVRQLRDRLTALIAKNEDLGRNSRNDLPIVLTIEPPKTPTGRLRRRIRVPVSFVHSAMVSRAGDGTGTGWIEMFAPMIEGGPLPLRGVDAFTEGLRHRAREAGETR